MKKSRSTKNQQDFLEANSIIKSRIDAAKDLLVEVGYIVAKDVDEAKRVLIESGYRVSIPIVIDEKIVHMRDLCNYFYKKLYDKYPERGNNYLIDSLKGDMRMIKLFVESREKTGLNRKFAIQECVSIINTIFDYEEGFCFKNPIDINVLGQKKSGWITEKAIYILNDRLKKEGEIMGEKVREEAEEDIGVDLNERSKELTAILKNVGRNN